VNVVDVTTIFKPVTVAAEVAVKRAVKKFIGSLVIPGIRSNPVPTNISNNRPVTS
jgi:hypothetical protein